jgi:hypothetical protein
MVATIKLKNTRAMEEEGISGVAVMAVPVSKLIIAVTTGSLGSSETHPISNNKLAEVTARPSNIVMLVENSTTNTNTNHMT